MAASEWTVLVGLYGDGDSGDEDGFVVATHLSGVMFICLHASECRARPNFIEFIEVGIMPSWDPHDSQIILDSDLTGKVTLNRESVLPASIVARIAMLSKETIGLLRSDGQKLEEKVCRLESDLEWLRPSLDLNTPDCLSPDAEPDAEPSLPSDATPAEK